MDFARKQLEKFGWKEGSGLGKNNQGMLEAIKPSLKIGKEGMGYDFSKELVDTWWTRAYDDSLNRINVEKNGDEEASETSVGVTLQEDDDDHQNGNGGASLVSSNNAVERPFEKMRKRMMKATFTTFSKGAILSNGEMIVEPTETKEPGSDDSAEGDTKKKSKMPKLGKTLTDEELFQACGGRTAHKAARFGLKLNGKLARIAAQEEAAKALLSSFKKEQKEMKSAGLDITKDKTDKHAIISQCPSSSQNQDPCDTAGKPVKDKKKKKKSKCREYEEINEDPVENEEVAATQKSYPLFSTSTTLFQQPCSENQEDPESENSKKRKKKKNKKRKFAEDEVEEEWQENPTSPPKSTSEHFEPEENSSRKSSSKAHKKNKRKSKKRKLAEDEEERALLSE